jgi:hypothetical protein
MITHPVQLRQAYLKFCEIEKFMTCLANSDGTKLKN